MSELAGELVSVIMPSYNAEALIARSIQSVIDQAYDNWELIVIDDCSKDSTRQVVQSFVEKDARIKLISLERNNGAPAAPRNIGVRHATGPWIAFLDADDIWHPQKLKLQMEALEKSGVDFCCTQMKDFIDDTLLSFPKVENVGCERISFAKQQLKGRIPTSSVVLKKEIMLRFPFNEDIRYKAVEDYHCWLRVHEAIGDSIKLSYPLLNYRRIAGQISGSKKYMLERMYMVHKEYPGTSSAHAALYTLTHALGGFYYRILRKGL
ncbi:Glycosyl transferase family 2 [Pseudomonas sp. NFACC32-1]|uniref:glycosyltransferase family 2 protein n=1 Tax=unclassified Pseudomonas TaxID=196821 RepID=UPI0008772E6C|nr:MULTISPECIES: glycosyltransferase family 2 protein [unclassified Pseudomonas]MDB6443491.1 glycosyltransferase family 2 protein [Pseudomonas sp. 21TX0197]SCX40733.1 Glycosyl transferase family 2 [Pseudomonas sp. NFACC32-1]SFX05949.1 Glycosyl transferase family 2 [Pseudomonas sp. NFACC49-2]SFX20789.1 Glycosyl transferase family 2 [Pseudomonas sp. NFACC36]SIS27222.1 teichuronic acid biosynthesis glycosyltransferase TuaG [Pseudomonas sp. 7SR1]